MIYQLGALDAFARTAGTRVRYLKPHGALYNAIVHHEAQAAAVVAAVVDVDPALPVLGLPGSRWLALAAEAGLTTVHEAFADRAYEPDGTLVPRGRPGAVLHDPDEIAARCVAMATGGTVTDVEGGELAWPRGRSACTATPRARSRSRARCGPRSTGAGSSSPRSREEPLMELRPSGSSAVLVQLDDLEQVLALYAALVDDPLPGVVDVVPAASTVLLVVDPGRTTPEEAGEAVRRVRPRPGARPRGEQVELPVRYDGEDLDDVARLLGCSPREVGGPAHRHRVDGGVLRLRPGLRLPHRRRRRLGRPPPGDARAPGCPRGRWRSPGRSAACTRGPRPAAGSCSAPPRCGCSTSTRDPAALLRPGTRVRFVEETS